MGRSKRGRGRGFFWIAADSDDVVHLCLGEYVGVPRVRPFCRYLRARYNAIKREHKFQVYVTEQVRLSGEGKYLPYTFESLLEPAQEQESGDEIALRVIQKIGMEVLHEPA